MLYVRVVEGFGSALLRSGDGGAHFEVVARTRDAMLGFAISDDGRTVWYGSPDEGLFRATDGGQRFTRVGMLPTHGLRFHGGALWLVTDWVRQPWALGRSMDAGEHFEAVLRFEDVLGPPMCARPSEGTVARCCSGALADAPAGPRGARAAHQRRRPAHRRHRPGRAPVGRSACRRRSARRGHRDARDERWRRHSATARGHRLRVPHRACAGAHRRMAGPGAGRARPTPTTGPREGDASLKPIDARFYEGTVPPWHLAPFDRRSLAPSRPP